MVRRTIRKTGFDDGGNQDAVGDADSATRIDTGIVHAESSDNFGVDTAEFTATDEAHTVTDYELPIEPTSINDNDQPTRRKYKRRADAGQPRGTRQKRVTFSSQGNLEKLLLSAHMMGAAFLKTPELRIDAEESAMLAKATLDVMKAYGVPELSDKQLAASQMIMALGTVYAPRIALVYHRTHQKPKLVHNTIPFPTTQTVQETMQQVQTPAPVQQPAQPNTYGAAPVQPPAQQATQPAAGGFVSSQVFAAATDTGLDTINAS